jgi:hypothetical protein
LRIFPKARKQVALKAFDPCQERRARRYATSARTRWIASAAQADDQYGAAAQCLKFKPLKARIENRCSSGMAGRAGGSPEGATSVLNICP